MSENKTYTGKVAHEDVFAGSKSEHKAWVLQTGDARYILRRQGEHPFMSRYFESWLGKKVTVSGSLDGMTIFVDAITEAF